MQLSFVITSLKYIAAGFIVYRENTNSAVEQMQFRGLHIGEALVGLDIFLIVSAVIVGVHAIFALKKKNVKAEYDPNLSSKAKF